VTKLPEELSPSGSNGGGKGPRQKVHVGITFHHPAAFWIGTAAIIFGSLLHLPDFLAAADQGYSFRMHAFTGSMRAGMFLILGGMLLAGFGLFPRKEALGGQADKLDNYHFHSMDNAELTGAHWGLLFVLGIALIVDVMKPATLGFTVPGMRDEYGISIAKAATLPLVALTGTTIGSVVWGMLSDRLGRRASILLASLFFMGTSICGFMPEFRFNLLMCFVMGLSAGGMLPIVYALMAESVPAKKRGWLVVLHGGMGTVGGYLAASGLAALLEPHFTWRMLWFMNLPTGALVLVLNRWIPESPRFLLERGRFEEARGVMKRYGVVLERKRADEVIREEGEPVETALADGEHRSHFAGMGSLFRAPYLGHTATILLYGVGWGLVNWGFLTFLPTIIQDQGLEASSTSSLLFLSALIAVPGTIVVAYMYGRWSSKWTMIIFALGTSATLVSFAIFNPGPGDEFMLSALVVALLVFSGGVISMLSPYTAEVYPTQLRGTGSGLAAGSSKLGGIIGPPVAAGALALAAGFTGPALLTAIPITLSAGVLMFKGMETIDRSLEDLTAHATGAGSGSVASPAARRHELDPEGAEHPD